MGLPGRLNGWGNGRFPVVERAERWDGSGCMVLLVLSLVCYSLTVSKSGTGTDVWTAETFYGVDTYDVRRVP